MCTHFVYITSPLFFTGFAFVQITGLKSGTRYVVRTRGIGSSEPGPLSALIYFKLPLAGGDKLSETNKPQTSKGSDQILGNVFFLQHYSGYVCFGKSMYQYGCPAEYFSLCSWKYVCRDKIDFNITSIFFPFGVYSKFSVVANEIAISGVLVGLGISIFFVTICSLSFIFRRKCMKTSEQPSQHEMASLTHLHTKVYFILYNHDVIFFIFPVN